MHRKRSSSSGKPSSPDKPSVDLSAEPDLEVRLSIDGRWVGTHVVGAAAVDRVTTFRGAAISDAMLRKFRFVQVSRSEEGSRSDGREVPGTVDGRRGSRNRRWPRHCKLVTSR